MLSFFRRAFSSWIVLALLGLIAVAVVVTGVGTPNGLGNPGAAARGESIATVDGQSIGADDLVQQAKRQVAAAQRQDPSADMAGFVAAGGVERTADQLISGRALEAWARDAGFTASDKLIDGDIASVAAFRGPTGKFDEPTYRQILARERMSEAQLRGEIAGDIIRRQLLGPIAGGAAASAGFVTPYASLLLETRSGQIGFVPVDAVAGGAAPTDAELANYYKSHLAAYSLPERRVFRYALFSPAQVKVTPPTEAEIAAFYKANAASYAAVETRTLEQVILPDEAAARALKAKIAGGQSFAAAAQAAGFGPSDTAVGKQSKTAFASLASPAAADAAFALPKGGVSNPVKSPLGWHVIRVEGIETKPGRTLAQARDEIAASLSRQKADEGFADLVAAVEDAIAGGSTFDDVVKSEKLAATTSPPVTAQGQAPDVPGYTAPPQLAPVLKAGFDANVDDDPTVESLGQGQPSVLLKLDRIVPAAPEPLAKVREAVARDFTRDRALQRAKAIADAIAAKANAGTPLTAAIAQAGVPLPAPKPAGGRQADLARAKDVPPALTMMFSMVQGRTRTLAAPNNEGWYVVQLQKIERGDATKVPPLIEATRQQFARIIGEEYAEQFVRAASAELKVKRDEAALRRVKAALVGGTAEGQ